MVRRGQLAAGCSTTGYSIAPRHAVVCDTRHECDPECGNSDSMVRNAEVVQSPAGLVEELVSAIVAEVELVHRSQEEVPEADHSQEEETVRTTVTQSAEKH